MFTGQNQVTWPSSDSVWEGTILGSGVFSSGTINATVYYSLEVSVSEAVMSLRGRELGS